MHGGNEGSRVRATAPTLGRVAFVIALPHPRGRSGSAATEDVIVFVSHSRCTGGEDWKLAGNRNKEAVPDEQALVASS